MTEPSWWQITISRDKFKESAETLGQWFNEHGARDWAIGEETGMDGYEHFQVVVHFKKGVSKECMFKWFGPIGHAEPSHAHSFDYAMKTGKYICSWPEPLKAFKNLDLLPWQAETIGILGAQTDREIMVLVDMIGGRGKSWLAKYLEANGILDVCPVVSEEFNDYTGYCFEYPKKGYLFDMPRSESTKRRKTMWAGVEVIKNGLLFEKRYHPRKMWIEPPKILIMTNDWPPVDALSHDRWVIYKLVQDKYGDQYLGEPRLVRVPYEDVPRD